MILMSTHKLKCGDAIQHIAAQIDGLCFRFRRVFTAHDAWLQIGAIGVLVNVARDDRLRRVRG